MLSFTKTITTFPVRTHHHRRPIPPSSSLTTTIRCDIKSNGNNNVTASSSKEADSSSSTTTPPADDNTVEIRFRRGSRQRRRREEQLEKDGFSAKDRKPTNNAPKDWSSMSLAERAVELYMGEKGLLFWLNKFAYASIFVVIGGWIVFRFVGPALNLYQLDTPPLAPASMFKGS